jgi:hypothetical protein
MTPIALKYRLGRLDVLAWMLRYLLRSPLSWIVVLIATGLRCWTLFRDGLAQSIPLLAWHGTITLLGAWAGYMLLVCVISLLRRQAGIGLEVDLTMHGNGLTSESALGKTDLKWAAIRFLRTGPWHVFLCLNSSQAIIIPNRCFPDAAARQAFVEACHASIAAARPAS